MLSVCPQLKLPNHLTNIHEIWYSVIQYRGRDNPFIYLLITDVQPL